MIKESKDPAWHKKQMDLPEMSNGANYLVFCRTLIIRCGGGGSVGASASHLSGSLVNSPVEGLEYATETQVGVTDANEAFMYKPVETCAAAIMIILMGSINLAHAAFINKLKNDPFLVSWQVLVSTV